MKKQNKQSLSDIVISGMKLAERSAIEKAIATDTHLVIWRNNKVVKISSKTLKKKLKSLDGNEKY